MANLFYRQQIPSTLPSSTTVKGAPLSIKEVNANFKALSDYVGETYSAIETIPTSFVGQVNVFNKNQSISVNTPYKFTNIIYIDASLSNNFRILVDDNYLLQNPTNYSQGQILYFFIKQGSTPHLLTFDTMYKFPDGSVPTLVNEANVVHFMIARYDSLSNKFLCNLFSYYLPSLYVLGSNASATSIGSLGMNKDFQLSVAPILGQVGNVSSITPDPYWADVILLLNAQNGISTDSSTFSNVMTPQSTATISSTPSLFGKSVYKILFDGDTEDGLSTRVIMDNGFFSGKFSNNEFCIETWYYPVSSNDLDGRLTYAGGFSLGRKSDGSCQTHCYMEGGDFSTSAPAGSLPAGSWSHIALVRDNTSDPTYGIIKLFINGNLINSTQTSKTVTMDNTGFGFILGYNDYGSYGYFSNYRITRNHARYYSNFTPPSDSFPTQ